MNQPGNAIVWKRTLRTPSSERLLAFKNGREAAAVDLHFLAGGTVTGTVILLADAGWTEDQIPALLKSIDDDYLPDVDLASGTLTYTVVQGHVVGNYEAQAGG